MANTTNTFGKRKGYFPLDINVMLLGTFLTRIGYFMVWPYLSLVLYHEVRMTPAQIGVFFFSSAFLATSIGVWVAHRSDYYGRKYCLILGLIISMASFVILPWCSVFYGYFSCVLGITLGRSIIESSSKSFIGDRLVNAKERESCQYYRYLIANVGVAVGPFIGAYFGVANRFVTFEVTALVYFLYMILAATFIVNVSSGELDNNARRKINFFTASSTIFEDVRFSVFIICIILLMIIYTTFDTSLIQYLNVSEINNLKETIALLIMTNALVVIFCQLPLFYILSRFEPSTRIVLGITLVTTSQLLFFIADLHYVVYLMLATIVLSIGEIIVMPTINVEIDRLTPYGLRGLAFGFANFSNFGVSLSPLIGGLILQYFGGGTMFISMFFVGAVTIFIYVRFVVSVKLKG